MKRLVVLIFCIIATLNVAADEVDKLKEWFNNGDYEAVMSHVDHLHNISPIKYNDEFVKIWKEKCNKAIKDKEKKEQAEAEAIALQNAKMKAKQDSIDAALEIAKHENDTQKLKTKQAIADAKKKEAEAKIKEEEKKKKEREDKERREKEKVRKENKLVYKSVNATTIGGKEYAGMSRAIKADGVKFTDKEELAYWSVYITAEVYDQKQNENVFNGENLIDYNSFVVAYLKIVNNITNSVIHQEEIKMNGSNTLSLEGATIKAYNKINKTIGEKIQELCK